MSNISETRHIPVLYEQVLAAFQYPGKFLDCTLGGAGHTEGLLLRHSDNIVWSIDRDDRALQRAAVRLARFDSRSIRRKGSFGDLLELVGDQQFDGVLADLGMSTDQLYEGRGFSFQDAGPLDMRMDEQQSLTAAEVVNEYSEGQLIRTLKQGGVGKEARLVAQAIVAQRPVSSSRDLAELVVRATTRFQRPGRRESHPATVIFQALRIEVNGELAQIRSLLEVLPKLIKPGGRLVVLSFHSLEDKEVTRVMRRWAQGSTVPAKLEALTPREPSLGRLLTAKALIPEEIEVVQNPAARSARMRVFEFF